VHQQFAVNKIVFLSRNLDQNMPKNGLVLEKNVKTAEVLGAPPQIPIGLWRLGLSPRLQVLILIYYCNFEMFNLLLVGNKNILLPKGYYQWRTLATPLVI